MAKVEMSKSEMTTSPMQLSSFVEHAIPELELNPDRWEASVDGMASIVF
jgi:hypothetical protein